VSSASVPKAVRRLVRGEPGYPSRLLDLPKPPSEIHVAGEMANRPAIAVVGTRKPTPDAAAFARALAAGIVAHGGIAVSGGAVGIDSATHEGALDAGGATWVVAATGPLEVFPRENAALFKRVVEEGGVMIWPFEHQKKACLPTFFARNGVLAALSNALVIVQAGAPSGTLNAASWATRLGRPVWAVCAPPWEPGFLGCACAIERGAKPLVSLTAFLKGVGLLPRGRGKKSAATPCLPLALPAPLASSTAPPALELTPLELALLEMLSNTQAQHIDEIAAKSGLSAASVTTALLTLALEDVVVESPEGFFSRVAAPITPRKPK
jgi:DNA processing protein